MKIFKKLFSKLQYKFFMVFLLTSILPIVVLTLFSINTLVDSSRQQAESNAIFQLRSVDETVYEKVKNIQRFIDIVNVNPVISKELSRVTPDYLSFESAMKSSLTTCEGLEGALLILPTGENFAFNINTTAIDIVRLQVIYSSIDNRPNKLTWFDNSSAAEKIGLSNDLMIVGTTYEYVDYTGQARSAKLYIFVDKSLFGDSLKKFSEVFVFITDKDGSLIASNDNEKYKSLVKVDFDMLNEIYAIDEGVFEKGNGSKYNVTVYTSNSTGFKYISIDDFEMFYENTHSLASMAFFIIAILLLVFVFLYLFIVKRITLPIHKINLIMQNFDDSTLNVRIPVESNDEVGNIANGFNKMVERINEMILEIENRKDNQRDAEIKALTYQINPHFLYNALSAVRIEAINNNDGKVAESLMCLSKILKSVFSNTEKFLTLSEEIDISRSTVNLIQLRYNKEISFKADFSEKYNSFRIPPMVLQPIIENSVLHGLAPKMENPDFQAKIDVMVQTEDADFVVRVIDNGVGMSDEKIAEVLSGNKSEKKGVGIYNVDERVKLLFGENYGLSIKSVLGTYTEVIIRFKITD